MVLLTISNCYFGFLPLRQIPETCFSRSGKVKLYMLMLIKNFVVQSPIMYSFVMFMILFVSYIVVHRNIVVL